MSQINPKLFGKRILFDDRDEERFEGTLQGATSTIEEFLILLENGEFTMVDPCYCTILDYNPQQEIKETISRTDLMDLS